MCSALTVIAYAHRGSAAEKRAWPDTPTLLKMGGASFPGNIIKHYDCDAFELRLQAI